MLRSESFSTDLGADRPVSRRAKLGRKLSRRLSLVTKVPGLITGKLKQDSQQRSFEVTTIAPDKTQRILPAESPQPIKDLVAPLLREFGLSEARLHLAGSQARVDPEVDVALLEGDILLVEPPTRDQDPRGDCDARFRLTEQLLHSELDFAAALGSAAELYGGPLRKLSCVDDDEHEVLFGGLARLSRSSKALCLQMSELLETWDTETSTVGPLFSDEFWNNLDDFQQTYRSARQLLREKISSDEEFVEFCKLRRGAAVDTLQSLLELPVQRLARYEQYFQSILRETCDEHPDCDDLSRASTKAKQAVKRGQEDSDLERIQDLFPNDCLRLYDKDVLTMKMKGLIRKRSTTTSRLQRALSAKALRPGAPEGCPGDPPAAREQGLPRNGQDKRQFLMEAPVQFTTGLQNQERHLFLFNDLLLVAKARSGGNFKLKDKVRVSELWLSRCAMDDVTEVHKSLDTSFVMGWPTTNVVATFNTQAARDLWWSKLNEAVSTERAKEPRSTNIQVLYYDTATNIEYCKTFSVGPEETARSCIRLALQHLEMRGLDPDEFQLWAKTAREEAPYPLIGHERPFAIKLSCLRDGLSTEEGFDLDHCNNVHGPDPLAKCQFVLRSKRKMSESTPSSESKKGSKKSRKTPIRIRQVFRRSGSKSEDVVDGPAGQLFGLPLSRVADGENMPPPVMAMLQQVFLKGPFTQGIFRKSANARLVRELREKLDAGQEVQLELVPVTVTAALLKEFVRSLPDSLLCSHLYPRWVEALQCPDQQERLLRVKSVLDMLPRPNLALLSLFLCVLHHIARRSSLNLMSAANLGVCVGSSLCWSPTPAPLTVLTPVPALVELLVTHCELLLGPHVPHLLGEPPERGDSGAEESDSLHSGGLRRDDSSIDSLERELMEPCPPPRKDKMSLSRDSGLTMSDSQLYTPDEEESGSTSSGSGRALYPPAQPVCYDMHSHSKVTPSLSVPAAQSTPTREYVRVYGGWEERVQECCRADDSVYARPSGVINPNFQRQDWFRQRSHLKRLNSGGGTASPSGSSGKTSGSSSGSASSGIGGLRRGVSEESLAEDAGESAVKRPAPPLLPPPRHREDWSRSADREENVPENRPREDWTRSRSTPHIAAVLDVTPDARETPVKQPAPPPRSREDWARSRSTPHIADEGDRSYDSSTLSDDDSTPHVSRSNSRGKDCSWETATTTAELLVHAAPVNVRDETTSAPPLPPKLKLRHLPPVHVDTTPSSPDQAMQWESAEAQTPKKPPERRGRLRHRDNSNRASQRSKSLPPPPGEKEEESGKASEERVNVRSEISWSVSQLRTLFANGNRPPPYRPPPSVIPSYRAPITCYHLGNSSQSERYVVSRRLLLEPCSTDEEESYV